MTTKCKVIFGVLFGHKIISEYDETSAPAGNAKISGEGLMPSQLDAILNGHLNKTSKFRIAYCKRCGQTINAKENE